MPYYPPAGGGSGDVTASGTLTAGAVLVGGGTKVAAASTTWEVSTSFMRPISDDGGTLGDATHRISDVFLAEGAVINWDNGDATITQTNNDITIAGITTFGVGTSTAFTVGTIELGHASQNTLSASSGVLSIEGVVIPSISSTNTLTNKRITKRVQSVADAATVTPSADNDDCVDITAIAQAFTIADPSGTPTNFQQLVIRIKDNGTARAITWGSGYAAGGVSLPSTTVLSKILTLGFFYNTANSLNKWQLVASAQEA